jgi:hypothetical protein
MMVGAPHRVMPSSAVLEAWTSLLPQPLARLAHAEQSGKDLHA